MREPRTQFYFDTRPALPVCTRVNFWSAAPQVKDEVSGIVDPDEFSYYDL